MTERFDIMVTCRLGFENVVASYLKELFPQARVVPRPYGFQGIVLIAGLGDRAAEAAQVIKARVPEAERVVVVHAQTRAVIDEIVSAARDVAKNLIPRDSSFAVKTTRRGRHSFTSIDVNVAVGAAVQEATGARVDLSNPDRVVLVEILQDVALISVVDGRELAKKMRPYKYPMYRVFHMLRVAHEPYLGPLDAARTMGMRVGRSVQTFEVGELVVAPIGPVDAQQLLEFLKGLFEGIESRYAVQERSYGRRVRRTRVLVQDMYQFVRMHMGEPMIVFEPEGEPISRVAGEVRELVLKALRRGKKVNILVGAREGVPVGVFRVADLVLDVAPGIVISTDYALSSALIALATILHEKLAQGGEGIAESSSS